MDNSNSYSSGGSLEQVIMEMGMLSAEQMEQVRKLATEQKKSIEQIILQEKLLTRNDLVTATSVKLNVPLVNLSRHKIYPEAIKLVPEQMARRYNVFPLEVIGNTLTVAMEDIINISAIDELAAISQKHIKTVMALPDDIRLAISRYYVLSQTGETGVDWQVEEEEAREEAPVVPGVNSPASRQLEKLIQQAVRSGASDIHIVPHEDRVQIRYRIDGVLQDTTVLPRQMHAPLISRLKIIAGMNIAEQRRSQDGQCLVKVDEKRVDVRVGCASTIYGEMAVMRLLSHTASLLELSELGMNPEIIEKYRRILHLPFGIILVGGPTGSGKTTTIYASINELDRQQNNIMTIEEPVEYRLEGINQFPVIAKADVGFASSLKAFMRMDPDIILVGEIRDGETARIATQAALTGHLVLSTIHANDAVGVVFRMIDLGVEPFLLNSVMAASISQRMARRICPSCRTIYKPSEEELAFYSEEIGELPEHFYRGRGCSLCSGAGYVGRIGIFELLTPSEEIKRMVRSNTTASQVHAQAVKEGMVTMRYDGMMKVKAGLTTISEILRTTYTVAS